MKVYVRLVLDPAVLDEIDRLALAADMSRSDFVAMLVRKTPGECEAEYLRGWNEGYNEGHRSAREADD